VLDELRVAERTGERFYEAELHRLEDELRRNAHASTTDLAGTARTPEVCFETALVSPPSERANAGAPRRREPRRAPRRVSRPG
jgi:hypothetical protein